MLVCLLCVSYSKVKRRFWNYYPPIPWRIGKREVAKPTRLMEVEGWMRYRPTDNWPERIPWCWFAFGLFCFWVVVVSCCKVALFVACVLLLLCLCFSLRKSKDHLRTEPNFLPSQRGLRNPNFLSAKQWGPTIVGFSQKRKVRKTRKKSEENSTNPHPLPHIPQLPHIPHIYHINTTM